MEQHLDLTTVDFISQYHSTSVCACCRCLRMRPDADWSLGPSTCWCAESTSLSACVWQASSCRVTDRSTTVHSIRAHQMPRRRHKNVQPSHILMTYDNAMLRVHAPHHQFHSTSAQLPTPTAVCQLLINCRAAAAKWQTRTERGWWSCLLIAVYTMSCYVTVAETSACRVSPAERSTFDLSASRKTSVYYLCSYECATQHISGSTWRRHAARGV